LFEDEDETAFYSKFQWDTSGNVGKREGAAETVDRAVQI
jgi:hypothetical protein